MATAYVSSSGTAAYPGTASVPTSITLALSSAGAGDIIYIAPGNYVVNNVTYGGASGTAGNPVQFIGNPTGSQFIGIPAGRILFTATSDLSTGTGAQVLTLTSKSYVNFSNITFDRISAISNVFTLTTCANVIISNCVFYGAVIVTNTAAVPNNNTFTKCVLYGTRILNLYFGLHTSNYDNPFVISDCLFIMINSGGFGRALEFYNTGSGAGFPGGGLITNCTLFGGDVGINHFNTSYDTTNPFLIRNNLFMCATAIFCSLAARVSASYNRYTFSALSGASSGTGSTSNGVAGVDLFESLLYAINNLQPFATYLSSPNTNFGTSTGAPATDLYGVTWTGTNPDAGSATYRSLSTVGSYLPTERNASAITIAPGSTSQSIELYLGATGLTASTTGLSARYNRTRTASVSIPLVARTIAQAWTSGGFAEVDATNMPGVYRVDIPDAALAVGADDVTLVVRGASGTNGAVMTIKLSSGGLTSAQTASAVWGASPAGYNDATTFGGVVNQIDQTVTGTSVLVQDVPSNVWQEQTDDHTTHGTFGYNILRADAPSKEGLVTLHQSGGISRVDADIHAIVNDTLAAAELKGALLHTGGDYISADLLTPVTSAQTVRIGPFAVRTDAGGADGALDLNQSTAGAVVVQLTDAQGTGIDQTSATVQAKVYNVAGGLVATYTCTPAYAVNGFVSIPMTTAVTGTAGSYIINLWSTVGATVIIYGPLQLRVRAI